MTGWCLLSATQLITYEMTAACWWRVIHQQCRSSRAWLEHLFMADVPVVGIHLSTFSRSLLAGFTAPCDWREVVIRAAPGSSHQGDPRCTLPFLLLLFSYPLPTWRFPKPSTLAFFVDSLTSLQKTQNYIWGGTWAKESDWPGITYLLCCLLSDFGEVILATEAWSFSSIEWVQACLLLSVAMVMKPIMFDINNSTWSAGTVKTS